MNNHQKGYRRDSLVLETISEWGTMDTEQIMYMFYPSIQVARRRLRIMTAKGRIKRTREAAEIPYCYYIGKYTYDRIALNWARIWLIKQCKSWEVLELFDYETNTAVVRNTVKNTVKAYAVLLNVTRKTWIGDNVIIVYDTEEKKRIAERQIKGLLFTVDDIKEGLKCEKALSC